MNILADIVIYQIVFLATASERDVHPDVAVGQLEAIVADLRDLPGEELASVRTRIRERLASTTGIVNAALQDLDSLLEAES